MPEAILDFGTNTFNLLIAEREGETFRVCFIGKEAVKLGRDGIHKGTITPEAMERGLEAIGRHMETIKKFGATEIHAYATSAMRNAVNGKEFADMIHKRFGFVTHIIDGAREAELIYRGIMESVDPGSETALIMDIGGGSNEFIICNDTGILWKHSFELGMARIIEQFSISDPVTPEEIHTIEQYFDSSLALLFRQTAKFKPTVLIGASGTFDTLADMAVSRFNLHLPANVPSMNISLEHYRELHRLLLDSTAQERLKMPGMEPVRVEMIVPATIFINFVFNRCGLTTMKQSRYALKEGVMAGLVKP
jgi:exopolyphosphatase / guanosine-5'-triphosphate,3'-diphosphate pyrophosphatase